MRNLRHLRAFCSLGLDEVFKKLLREYSACCEVIVICLERIESCFKRCRKTLELCLLLLGKVEEIEIVRTPTSAMRLSLWQVSTA